jgi:hypothetical protein
MHDSHVLKEDGERAPCLVYIGRDARIWLFRIVFTARLVAERIALRSIYVYCIQTALLHRYIHGRDSARLLWWRDVRIDTLPSQPKSCFFFLVGLAWMA